MKFILLTLFLFSVAHSAFSQIRVAREDWCPYTCTNESENHGFVLEIVEHIYKDAGHKLEYTSIPWPRASKEMKAGRQDMVLATSPYEFPEGIFPQEEIGVYYNYFFTKKETDWHYQNLDSLNRVNIGGVKGYNYLDIMPFISKNSHTDKVQLLTGSHPTERNIKKLLSNRIDVLIEDINVALYNAYKLGVHDKIKISGKEGKGIKLYIAFSPVNKNAKSYAKIFDEGIRKLRKSGKLKEILSKYKLTDWK